MKTATNQHQKSRGFTATELIAIICVFALLMLALIPMLAPRHRVYAKASRIQCINNQKQIGTAYRIWSGDNNERYPSDVPNTQSTNGGWHDFTLLTNAGQYAWSNFTIMQNELGQSPKVLVCPSDERTAALTFSNFNNKNLSYFFAPGANENFPFSILGGDRNLAPGTTSKNDFGYSSKDGKGNDVILQTNSPVCWSIKIHSAGNSAGAGNILMGDGSVMQVSSARLRSEYLPNAAVSSNFPAGFDNSQSNSFRLIFP
jgi:competence protein ComGC